MNPVLKTSLVSFLSLSLTALPVAAQVGPSKQQVSSPVSVGQVVFQQADGTVLTADAGDLRTATRNLPGVTADGVEDPDALALFEADEFHATFAADGSDLIVERHGNTLHRVWPAAEDGANALSVRWNETLDTLFINVGSERHVLQLEGVADPLARARHLARLALLTLGGTFDYELAPEKSLTAIIFGIVALAAITSYTVCMLEGADRCLDQAQALCPNGVKETKVICGSGFDLEGQFQLGYNCSYSCYYAGGGGGPDDGGDDPSGELPIGG